MSVQEDGLTGCAFGFSLTVRDCPPDPESWSLLVKSFSDALMQAYRTPLPRAVRLHWLTEWQKRRCPHLHGVVWLPDMSKDEAAVVVAWVKALWVERAATWGASPLSQDCKPVFDRGGWFDYLAKHSARGVSNIQRDPSGMPPKWQGRTGRMWGRSGVWPLQEPVRVDDARHHYAFRRILKRVRVVQVRKDLEAAKRLLSNSSPAMRSAVSEPQRAQSGSPVGPQVWFWGMTPTQRTLILFHTLLWASQEARVRRLSSLLGAARRALKSNDRTSSFVRPLSLTLLHWPASEVARLQSVFLSEGVAGADEEHLTK